MSRRPQSVLVVASKLEGGIGRLALNLATAMSRHCKVILCELYQRSTWSWVQLAQKKGVQVINLRRSGRYDVLTPFRLARTLRQLRPDVINSFDKTSNLMSVLAARLSLVPVTTVCDVLGMVSGFRGWWHHLQRATLRLADGVVVPSEALAAKCLQQAPFIEGKLAKISEGILLSEFRPKRMEPRTQPSESFYLGAVNALYSEIKGLKYAICALSLVRRDGIDARLRVFGDGPLRPSMERLAQELGVSDVVEFMGHVSDMGAHFEQIDALIMPSLSEGMPMALLEASAVGLPAIASAVGGIPEFVQDGLTGLLTPPGDVQHIVVAIRRLASDPALAQELGRNARRRVEQSFDIEKNAQEYLRFYEQLMAREPGGQA